MTYGRPSMTSHLPSVPLPEAEGSSPVGETRNPSLMAFYIATIELYQILDSILSDVYNAWRGRSSNTITSRSAATKQAGLDVVIDLEERLFEYESNVPSFLSWVRQSTPAVDSDQVILDRQRNVLHARYVTITFQMDAKQAGFYISASSSIGPFSLGFAQEPTRGTCLLVTNIAVSIRPCYPNVQPPVSEPPSTWSHWFTIPIKHPPQTPGGIMDSVCFPILFKLVPD